MGDEEAEEEDEEEEVEEDDDVEEEADAAGFSLEHISHFLFFETELKKLHAGHVQCFGPTDSHTSHRIL